MIFFSEGGTLWCQNRKFLFFKIFKISYIFFQKQVDWDQTGTKINKVKDFGDSSHKTVEMPACFRLLGPKMAPLSRNRVKIDLELLKFLMLASLLPNLFDSWKRMSYKPLISAQNFTFEWAMVYSNIGWPLMNTYYEYLVMGARVDALSTFRFAEIKIINPHNALLS